MRTVNSTRWARWGWGLCLLLLAPSAVVFSSPPVLELLDVFELELASDPGISPDGERIVYVRSFQDIQTDQRFTNLWIVDFDGGNHRPLTTGNYHDGQPRWSPDGKRLIYVSDRDGSAQIHQRWMDTGQTSKLTHLPSAPLEPSFSPDGRWIVFSAHVEVPPPTVATLPPAPAGAQWAAPAKVIDRLSYRFDQAGYLKPGHWQVFVLPAEGGTPRQVTGGDFSHGAPGFLGTTTRWDVDNQHLIVTANRREDAELEPLDTEIYEVSRDGGEARPLTRRHGPDHSPVLSPDGAHIAYLGFDERYQGYQTTRLYVMNRDGSGSRLVSGDLDRSVRDPLWDAEGKGLYFLYAEKGSTRLAYRPLSGAQQELAGDVGGGASAYAGGTYTVSGNGRFAYSYADSKTPGDIAVGDLAGGETRVLTHVNEDLLGHKALGEVEEIWYESSHDRRPIHAWILKPPGFDPARKYPLILEIHGGPFAAYGPSFDLEKQMWAAQGYVVLYTNPRGSTSYGQEFGNLIHHAYPGDDFYDLDSGVDAVLARGYIDPENLFVSGGSGGGVLTCWMIGRSQRFRAAVSLYPVINWTSWLLTADVSAFGAKYWFPGLPWDHPEHYESRSLLSVIKNVTTPTMVLTGEEDYRTPMSESEQYFQALQLLGVESVLVRVPGEPHGLARRPSHLMQKIANVVGWFEKHRKREEAPPSPTK